MLSATGILNTTTSLEVSVGAARNSLTYELQAEQPVPGELGAHRRSRTSTRTPSRGTTSPTSSSVADARATPASTRPTSGPFMNENKTFDVLANLTKIWGAHASKFGVYYQNSYKAQSNFASFNATVNFVDNSSNPYDTGYSYANAATGVFNTYKQANKFAYPEYVYKNFEFYGQDNWKATSRLTARLRRPLLLHDAAVGPDAPGVHVPPGRLERRQRAAAVLPGLQERRLSLLGQQPDRRGSGQPRQHGGGSLRRPARSTHDRRTAVQRGLPGRPGDQRHDVQRERLQGVAPARRRLRPDGRGPDDRPRRLRDLLRPPPGQHRVRHDQQRSGPAAADRAVGDACRTSPPAASDPYPTARDEADGVRLRPAEGHGLERRRAAQAVEGHHPRHRLRRLQEREPPRAGADQRPAAGHALQAREPGPDPGAELDAGRLGPDHRPPASVPGLRQHPLVGRDG